MIISRDCYLFGVVVTFDDIFEEGLAYVLYSMSIVLIIRIESRPLVNVQSFGW